MIIKAYENEDISYSHCGTPSSRESFRLANPRLMNTNKEGVRFTTPGIYQFEENSPIIFVLPFFFKNRSNHQLELTSGKCKAWFDAISSLGKYLDDTITISDLNEAEVAWEPILYSIMLFSEKLIKIALEKEYFQQININSKTIVGKWDVSNDIKHTKKPTSFTCTVNTARNDNIILGMFKGVFGDLIQIVTTNSNRLLAERILLSLEHVERQPVTALTFGRARRYLNEVELGNDWEIAIEFFYDFFILEKTSLTSRGISFCLPMDSFFEDLVADMLVKLKINYRAQYSIDVLGGSRWIKNNVVLEKFRDSSRSRPDFVFTDENNVVKILEVKYKQMILPPNRDKSNAEEFHGFKSADRNQLLSFVMSYLSRELTAEPEFYVLYPYQNTDSIDMCVLDFHNAEYNVGPGNTSIVFRSRSDKSNAKSLKIHFLGINISMAIEWLVSNEQIENKFGKLLSEFLMLCKSSDKPEV